MKPRKHPLRSPVREEPKLHETTFTTTTADVGQTTTVVPNRKLSAKHREELLATLVLAALGVVLPYLLL